MSYYENDSISIKIPDLLDNKLTITDIYRNYNTKGNVTSYGIDLEFSELDLYKTVKASDIYSLKYKIVNTLNSWEKKYNTYLTKINQEKMIDSVESMNEEATKALEGINNILLHTLDVDDKVDWNSIKRKDAFRIKPLILINNDATPEYLHFNNYGKPTHIELINNANQPTYDAIEQKYSWFSKIFRKEVIRKDYDERLSKWRKQTQENQEINKKRQSEFEKLNEHYEELKKAFENEKKQENEKIDIKRENYLKGESTAIEDYCEIVLANSEYPDYFPQNWTLEYHADNKMLLVEYSLPSPSKLPTIKSYKYIKSSNSITEQHLSATEQKKIYDKTIYQICIRTIHELFEADVIASIDVIAFNGLVTNTNPATGIKETKTIISVVAEKEQFLEFDLSKVDAKATFKHLKGVSASSLIDLTPIPPIVRLDKSDKRIIEGKMIAANLDDSVNLAAMNWEDFEHLIRELFEKEFKSNGGEVKVTQASSDGGVDAIAFDPDPIRGGKIVIQAKRYTNTVGVAAVRDLYGTVMNEGATKGILVTTSDYGKDSYEFAKDKPITLLNGNNLLSLLDKHGHKARINISEAKKIINSQ